MDELLPIRLERMFSVHAHDYNDINTVNDNQITYINYLNNQTIVIQYYDANRNPINEDGTPVEMVRTVNHIEVQPRQG